MNIKYCIFVENGLKRLCRFLTGKVLTVELLEAECNTIRNTKLAELPVSEETLLAIGKEQSRKKLFNQHEFMEYQKSGLDESQRELRELEKLVHEAKIVDNALGKMIDMPPEVDQLASLERKYRQAGDVFNVMRDEFYWVLRTYYPVSPANRGISLEDHLQLFVNQSLEDKNDPYLKFDPDTMTMEQINFLMQSQILARHPHEPEKFRLIDFSRDS